MIAYLDTSALVKRYIDEIGTSQVLEIWRMSERVATSPVAFAETLSALHRRRRESSTAIERIRVALEMFRSEWPGFLKIEVSDELNTRLVALVERHPLRGFDAIHLASAMQLSDAVPDDMVFVCADRRLTEVAHNEGLRVLPETWDQ